jgi:hypothetical protein
MIYSPFYWMLQREIKARKELKDAKQRSLGTAA